MIVTCQQCSARLTIPDDKIPRGREASVKCPKCQGKITIQAPGPVQGTDLQAEKSPVESSAMTPSAPLGLGERQHVMACIDSDDLKRAVTPILQQMGFDTQFSPDAKTAIKDLEYHIFDLLIVEDLFDGNRGFDQIIKKMNATDMSSRRKTCLLLVSRTISSNDNMAALRASVNCIINMQDISFLGTFLMKVLADHRNFYTVYNESLKRTGKA